MQRHPDYTQQRIRAVVRALADRIYLERTAVNDLTVAGPTGRISYAAAQSLGDFRPARPGDGFGPLWATFWFRVRAVVPPSWKGSRVDLLWDSQSEATLWIGGRSVQGLNMTHGDRPEAILLDAARGGETIDAQIEMACNQKFGAPHSSGPLQPPPLVSPYILRRCELARFDPVAWELYYDALCLSGLLDELVKDNDITEKNWAGQLLAELNRFCNAIDLDDRGTWQVAGRILKPLLQSKNGTRQLDISAIGHAHIDTAWLWPLAETHRKCERSFSTAVAYMREYPEYRFSCSQAYQYGVIKQRNPDLYERIRQAVKTGQWNVVGGSWIEPDCNIPSGESLCRQFLLGQRFFQREFGVRCKEFWNPDVFGYNGQLPQIMRLAGITHFLTQKLSWNRFNKPVHGTFAWQGIDGSEVIAHFPPADSYNAMEHGPERNIEWLRANAKRFKDHDRAAHGVMLFGYGDGGGGPTRGMLETLRRVKDLQGLPRFEQRTSDEFFKLIRDDLADGPLQVGELYFEYHRGTYTSQALVKKNNRKGETLLHDLELLSVITSDRIDVRPQLTALWETLLLNQFHDILPGSSIKEVYDDSAAQFSQFFQDGEHLAERLAGRGTALLNTIGVSRSEVVEQDGKLAFVSAAPFAAATPAAPPSQRVTVEKRGDYFQLANTHMTALFDLQGRLVSLLHTALGREMMGGIGNVFETYDDRPNEYDAWDADPFHLETRKDCAGAHAANIVTDKPLRAEVRFEHRIGNRSSLVQTVRLDADARRLEFHTTVDWQENQTFLKVAFPVAVRAMNATYEMPFGNVERPTHYNTPYDLARYEVPLHRWFDLSEFGAGCALLNESKYGGSTFGNTMRLSLLRSPMSPDPTCDRGSHQFAYALTPHASGWREAGVVAEALRFNCPLRPVAAAPSSSVATIDTPNLIIDAIKRAEDSDATIVRLYECHGARGAARLTLHRPFRSATPVNVLEEPLGVAFDQVGSTLDVGYKPYEIISLKLE